MPAKWSIGRRTAGAVDAGVDDAVREGTILRTHVLRPTWHFVAREDMRWLLAATGPRVHALNRRMYATLELDDRTLARAHHALGLALDGANHRTRQQLRAVLHEAGIVAEGQRLAYIIMHAELSMLICSGSPRGKQQTYALLAERAPGTETRDTEELHGELARRYFTGHGPATVRDLTWWSSLTLAQAARAVEIVGAELDHFEFNDDTYWSAVMPRAPRLRSPQAHLLQGYDEYFSYGRTRTVGQGDGVAGGSSERVLPFTHVVLMDGQLIGRWRFQPGGKRLAIETRLQRALTADEERALLHAVDEYGRFLGAPIAVARRAD